MGSHEDATRSRAPAIAAEPPAAAEPGELFTDDPEEYVVEGEIGAGGMGQVLSARAARLARPVALKVISEDRADLRRRFEREQLVTARLQHPSIVPVYGAGRARDGRPFYAMKQVSGEPLDAVIARAATLDERIALLPKVLAVSEAIAYAHAERIIHRDLKPANILVGSFGETVVIDWGLAKDLAAGGDDDPAAGPYRDGAATDDSTRHGKVMGTPAYMPIEQARGEPVTERADVYALGAILYHLLAGRPPYRRSDEPSVPWESMVARVLSAEPPSLETLQPGLPRDLLAIVARAMARSAADRYATAGELADDLRRFQTGQLVGAHRYSTRQLIARWIKRNRTAVTVGGLALVVLAIVGVVSVRRIFAEQARTERQRALAVESRDEAEGLLAFMLGDLRTKLQAVGKLDLLDAVSRKAIAYYDRRGEDLAEPELVKRAAARRNLGDVLKAQGHADLALAEYRASLAMVEPLVPAYPELRFDVAASRLGIGEVVIAQGDAKAALAEFRAGLALLEAIAAAEPGNPGRQHDVATAHDRIANVLIAQADTAGALAEYRAGAAIDERLAAAEPTNAERQHDLAIDHDKVGNVLLAKQDAVGALAEYRRALAIIEKQLAADRTNAVFEENLARDHASVAGVLVAQGNLAGALAEYATAEQHYRALVARDPSNADRQGDMVALLAQVGDVLVLAGDTAGALAKFRSFLAAVEALAKADPTNLGRKWNLIVAHERIGNMLHLQGDNAGALAEARAQAAIAGELATADPTNRDKQRAFTVSHEKIGDALLVQGDAAGALEAYRAELAGFEKLAMVDPSNESRQRDLGVGHMKVGEGLRAVNKAGDALIEYRAADALFEALAAKDRTNAARQQDVVWSHERVGDVLLLQRDGAGALATYRAELSIAERLAALDATNLEQQQSAATAHYKVADALLVGQRDARGALAELEIALGMIEKIVAAAPKNIVWKANLPDLHERIGDALRAAGDVARARTMFEQSLREYQELRRASPTDATLPAAVERVRAKALR